jgi:hypothetical protein
MALSKIDVANMVTGATPVANGGTGLTSGTTNQFLKFTGSTTLASAADNAGLSVARQFRLTSNFSGSAQPIASNWEEADTDGYGGIGTISESSGIYSFGATGIYFIEFRALHQFDQADDYTNIIIQTTTDNSSYDTAAITNIGLDGQYHHFGTASFIFDVTNVSTHKVRFTVNGANGSNSTKGNTAENQTAVTFIRLGDT